MKLRNVAATEAFARRMAVSLPAPFVLTLSGEMGAGKTTFARALLRSLGVTGAIKSPTFSLVESYPLEAQMFHHFDLYRIHELTELDYIGFRDYFTEDAICCIEWPERAQGSLKAVDLALTFHFDKHGLGRLAECVPRSARGKQVMAALIG